MSDGEIEGAPSLGRRKGRPKKEDATTILLCEQLKTQNNNIAELLNELKNCNKRIDNLENIIQEKNTLDNTNHTIELNTLNNGNNYKPNTHINDTHDNTLATVLKHLLKLQDNSQFTNALNQIKPINGNESRENLLKFFNTIKSIGEGWSEGN